MGCVKSTEINRGVVTDLVVSNTKRCWFTSSTVDAYVENAWFACTYVKPASRQGHHVVRVLGIEPPFAFPKTFEVELIAPAGTHSSVDPDVYVNDGAREAVFAFDDASSSWVHASMVRDSSDVNVGIVTWRTESGTVASMTVQLPSSNVLPHRYPEFLTDRAPDPLYFSAELARVPGTPIPTCFLPDDKPPWIVGVRAFTDTHVRVFFHDSAVDVRDGDVVASRNLPNIEIVTGWTARVCSGFPCWSAVSYRDSGSPRTIYVWDGDSDVWSATIPAYVPDAATHIVFDGYG